MATKKSAARLQAEIREALTSDRMRRQAELLKSTLEPLGFEVTISEPRSQEGARHVRVTHPNGFRETFGISVYGVTPGEISFTRAPRELEHKYKMAL